jgi:anion-transporting  ArsA/GET3 family ATPase
MLDKRLIIVAGKGGVGRTTIAAALGTVLARRGRRTLLAHVRCRQRLGQLLGCGEVGDEILQVEPNLWVVNMNPRAALREIGLMVLRFRALYRAVLDNRLVRYFLRALPALQEYSMMGKAWYHTTEEINGRRRFDTVIFDGPATGHLIAMLRIPRVIVETVPAGPLTRDARKLCRLMSDPSQTGMWIVTVAEEMPVSEALDLYAAARDQLQIPTDRLVVNMVYPDPFGSEPALEQALEQVERGDEATLRPLASAARTLARRRGINEDYLQRLQQQVPLPQIRLPQLFVAVDGRPVLDRIARALEAALEGGR